MTKVTVQDGESKHTGSTVVGDVLGTIDVGSNSFFSIGGQRIAVSDGVMVIPSHQFIIFPPAFHSHNYTPDTITNNYFYIEGKQIITVGDTYSSDATEISNAGSNAFFNIS